MTRKFTFLMTAMALIFAIMGPRSVAWGQTTTVTLTQSILGLAGSYTTNTEKEIDGITYVYTDLMKNNDNIQAKASSGTIRNKTAFSGDITSVAITHSGTARATTILGSSDGTDFSQVATGSGSITADFSDKGYKYFKITRGSNAAYWTKIEITYSTGSSTDPVINADDVELAYDATSGEISYSITNPISSTTLSAETNDTWISGITVNASNVTFTTTENETSSQRVGTITLSYTGATSKDVTVTQAAAPQEGVLFYESFDTNDGTGGNDDSWSGSIASNDL